MVNVVGIYDYFLPAFKAGGPIQSLYNMAGALEKDVNLRIVCSYRDHDGTQLHVAGNRWTKYRHISVYYCSGGFYRYRKLFPATEENVFFINGMYSLHYNILPAWLLPGRKIISARGMLHPGGLLEKKSKKALYLRLARLLGLHKRCEFHATTAVEERYIHDVFGDSVKIWVVPNLPKEVKFSPLAENDGQLKIATVALISPMKNHLAVLRALARCSGEIRYDIYGAIKDKAYWHSCMSEIAKLPKNVQVRYHGPIASESVELVLNAADIYVQPSKAENFGHSLYEALAKGRPVITSHSTPWGNLEQSCAGINVDPEIEDELVAAINRFVSMDRRELNDWSCAAADYAKAAVEVEEVKRKYIEMFTG